MIDLKELRIDNSVIFVNDQAKSSNKVINGVIQDHVFLNDYELNPVPLKCIQPIEINYEILQKSEFSFTGEEWFECALPYGKLINRFKRKYAYHISM